MNSYTIVADLSIPLEFRGAQPNAYGVDAAMATSLGDTRGGSSVNFEQYTFTPHCNGTHTECVGHITDERISIRNCLKDASMFALLVSVEPEHVGGNRIFTAGVLTEVLSVYGRAIIEARTTALIVRTLPNDDSKLSQVYGADCIPPYFSPDSIKFMIESGFEHLLVDLPSIDPLLDEGKLAAHRTFWNVEFGSRKINAGTRINSTITELIYVPNSVLDGVYLLNLQIAPFDTDAAPSRPVLVKPKRID